MGNKDAVFQEILNTINALLEIEKKDDTYFKILRSVLKNLYKISKDNDIKEVFIEIGGIEDVLNDERNDQKMEQYLEKLIKLKEMLEQNLLEKNKVLLLLSEEYKNLTELVNMLNRDNIEVIFTKENTIETILFYNPNVIIIQNDNNLNLITILKSIRDEKLLDQIPVLVISKEDYKTKIECLKLGAIDYFDNNFDIKEIYLKVLNLINVITKCNKDNIYDINTGLYTRKHGETLAVSLIDKIKVEGKQAVFLLIDFDFMAEINKKMGILLGNKIINKVISEFKKNITRKDIAYRVAGDEFAFLFYDRDILWVKKLAEDILEFTVKYGDEIGLKISYSAGALPITRDYKEYSDVVLKAREAVATAKMEGRGKVVIPLESFRPENQKNILFVDDDKIILSILKSRYKSKGFNVFTASDGTEALDIIENNNIDLVVTDYYLKLMNGDELIKRIKEKYSKLPVIVLSSQKNEDYIKRTLDLGADDYVVKPFSPVELDSRIKKLLN
ncbi:response regulator [Thermovenabulum sp.]|uniref:response regulator n=1 Tax=Thermovenabulum sp. TaxID=3100335 RepID=UPI003C797936